MTRYRIDVLGDIHVVEKRIASNRKTAATTLNQVSARVADATLGSLTRRLEALREELKSVPERPMLVTGYSSFRMTPRATPLSADEIAALAIPDFLRRVS